MQDALGLRRDRENFAVLQGQLPASWKSWDAGAEALVTLAAQLNIFVSPSAMGQALQMCCYCGNQSPLFLTEVPLKHVLMEARELEQRRGPHCPEASQTDSITQQTCEGDLAAGDSIDRQLEDICIEEANRDEQSRNAWSASNRWMTHKDAALWAERSCDRCQRAAATRIWRVQRLASEVEEMWARRNVRGKELAELMDDCRRVLKMEYVCAFTASDIEGFCMRMGVACSGDVTPARAVSFVCLFLRHW